MTSKRFTIQEATPEQAAAVDAAVEKLRRHLRANGFGSEPEPATDDAAFKELERFLREPRAITRVLTAKAQYLADQRD